MNRGLIVASGDMRSLPCLKAALLLAKEEAAFVIAVDGGMRHLMALDIAPDLWVGDMDSFDLAPALNQCGLTQAPHWLSGVETLNFSSDKDMSDSELAIEAALARGATHITLMGMLGGRVDHMLFNLSLLVALHQRHIEALIVDGTTTIYYLAQGQPRTITGATGATLSIMPLTDLKGIFIEGCKYPLNGVDMVLGSTLTLSNVVVDDRACVRVEGGHGYLYVDCPCGGAKQPQEEIK